MFDAGSIIFNIKAAGAAVFQRDLQQADQATKQLEQSQKAAAKSTDEFGKQQDKAGKKSDELGKKTKQLAVDVSSAQRTVGVAAVGIGTAFLAMSGLAAKAAVEWETAWTGVTKTVDTTPEKLEEIQDGLRGLAKTLPETHTEIAAVAEAAGQLGVSADSIVDFTKTMINLGETTNLTSDEAATAIAQLMNVMQTAPEDVDRVGSALVALGNDGASTERDIILMAQRIAGAGKIVGMTEGDVLGFANALASVGIDAEAGGSAISRVMTDIAKAVSQGGDDLDGFAEVAGVSSEQFAKDFKEKPAEAIATFIKGLGDINAAGGDVFTTLDDLGQSDIRTSNALLGMANSGDLLTKSLKLGATSWEENNALQIEAQKRYATTAAKMEIAKNNIDDAAISLGQVFLPILGDVSAAVSDFTGFVGGLPAPLQGLIGELGVGAGAVLLFGGLMLLAVPKIVEFRAALAVLTTQMPATRAALGQTAAFLKGPWGIAIAAAVVGVALLGSWLDSLQASSGEVANSLITATKAADVFAVAAKGKDVSWFTNVRKDLGNLGDVLDAADDQANNLFTRFDSKHFGAFDALKDIGKELGKLAQTDLPVAQHAFSLMTKGQHLNEKQLATLLNQMPDYRDELVKVASAQGINVTGMAESAKMQALVKLAMEQTTDATKPAVAVAQEMAAATQAATEEQLDWIKAVSEADASFVDIVGAYDSVIQKNKDMAQATADGTKSSQDSWEDFYDGVSVALDDYLAELQSQVDAQTNWEKNMVLLSGRVSQGMIDELAKLGPEGAPLVAQLVTASDDELAKMEGLYVERAAAATGKFSQTLLDSQTVIKAAAGQLGDDAANEVATKLANGTETIAQIISEYGLKIEGMNPVIRVNTAQAQANLDAFFIQNENRLSLFGSRVANGRGSGGITFGDTIGKADGGKVNFYANGGAEHHIAQFARAGTMRVWAEPETEGEWYIPAAKSKRQRSAQVLAAAASEFGYQLVPAGAQHFADGGRGGSAPTMAPSEATVNVYPQPGMSEEIIGRVAASELNDLMRRYV